MALTLSRANGSAVARSWWCSSDRLGASISVLSHYHHNAGWIILGWPVGGGDRGGADHQPADAQSLRSALLPDWRQDTHCHRGQCRKQWGSGLSGRSASVFGSAIRGRRGQHRPFRPRPFCVEDPFLADLACLASAVQISCSSTAMGARATGAQAHGQIEGLRHYLSVAEEDRMNITSAPRMSPRHFRRSAYAM
ncbi:MAG: hypothetical protein R3D56_13450 [Paracoccaceae bacterium]